MTIQLCMQLNNSWDIWTVYKQYIAEFLKLQIFVTDSCYQPGFQQFHEREPCR